MKQVYEWDQAKAQINLTKHKVSFDEAETVFDDHFCSPTLMNYIQIRKIVSSALACPKDHVFCWLFMLKEWKLRNIL